MYRVIELHLIKKHKKNLRSAGLLKTYEKILSELETDPFSKTHKFELLENRKPHPSLYAKKISKKDRLVYSVDLQNRDVTIFSAWGHYESGNQSLIHHDL